MPDGIVIIDKPADWTSMDVCAKLRGIFHEKRVGHAGTLDPMATGVLPVFVGRATRAVSFAESGKKEYIAGLRLGCSTDTQDTGGTILQQLPVTAKRADLERVLPRFTGDLQQIPPMYSALKINGQKLCDLARKGKEVERAPRAVTVYELELLPQTGPADYTLRCLCSKGTYIRTLCHNIGQALGCGGCMSSLRRTMAAGFTLGQAVTLEEVQERREEALLALDRFFQSYPAYTISSRKEEERCRNGNPVREEALPAGTYRVYGQNGEFLCLSECRGGVLISIRNFFGGKDKR